MGMISILVCSRISGNKNWSLFNLLESLKQKSSSYENFEVLIKFDSDDKKVGKVLSKLDTYPFKIKYLVESRGRGYLDLYIFYNRLFSLVDKKSVVIAAMADDFEIIQKNWDEIILSKVNIFPDQIFIIRTGSTVLPSRNNKQEQRSHLNFDINALEDLYIVDEAPFWARKLLDVCGGVGHIGSSTDVWTITLEYYLFHRCGINRTIFLEQPLIYRKTRDEIDQPISLRWWTDRKTMFAFARSSFFKTLVEQQALNIYCNIKMAEMSALPPQFIQKKSDFKPTVLTPNEFRKLKYWILVSKLKRAMLNLFPGSMHPTLKRLYRDFISHRLRQKKQI
jgi:hypothetical protein